MEKTKVQQILDEVKELGEGNDIVTVEEKTIKLVLFLLGGSLYAFEGDCVKEILPVGEISFVPGALHYIPGIINIRGDIESVLDLGLFLGLEVRMVSLKSRIILARSRQGIRTGILVDSVEDVLDVAEAQILETLPTLGTQIREYVRGETCYQGKNVTILDLDKMLALLVP